MPITNVTNNCGCPAPALDSCPPDDGKRSFLTLTRNTNQLPKDWVGVLGACINPDGNPVRIHRAFFDHQSPFRFGYQSFRGLEKGEITQKRVQDYVDYMKQEIAEYRQSNACMHARCEISDAEFKRLSEGLDRATQSVSALQQVVDMFCKCLDVKAITP